MNLTSLWSFITEYGPITFLFLALLGIIIWLLRAVLNPAKADGLRATFYGVLHTITKKRDHEKRYIANDLNSRINTARQKLNFTHQGVASAVSVEWVEHGAGRFYDIREGEFVVCLDSRECQEQNVVRLATAVVERTTLIGIRHIFSKSLAGAIDLNLVRDILFAAKTKRILDWFFSNELSPALHADPNLRNWHDQIRETDERGLFTRILLVELAEFARRVYGLAPRPFMVGELEDLVVFVHRIATKPFGRDVPLEFLTAYVKTGLILVADDKILSSGIDPYVHAATELLRAGVESLYLISWDKRAPAQRNRTASRTFEKRIGRLVQTLSGLNGLQKDGSHRYSTVDSFGNPRMALCVRFSMS